ncbi:hypothetical protein DPMN_090200 [Dreissena polymorpha]|uniref:Uncharacterized protein n=1 Tax=Dreissena polymorpha TaxID=45954 RepID=A0A9D4KXA2_DREPO|nr:hypothetical protein DPMN_090200 [Dreissena polymorpha]
MNDRCIKKLQDHETLNQPIKFKVRFIDTFASNVLIGLGARADLSMSDLKTSAISCSSSGDILCLFDRAPSCVMARSSDWWLICVALSSGSSVLTLLLLFHTTCEASSSSEEYFYLK